MLRCLKFMGRVTAGMFVLVAIGLFLATVPNRAAEAPSSTRAAIKIADLKRSDTVDFEKEILPLFRASCLACHNQTTTKGELILETPQSILKGGESGPAVVPGKSSESLLLQLATHQKRPLMPPKDNKAAAPDLTPQELALVKLWIDQGAKGEVHGQSVPIAWQPLPDGLNPIYAVALTPDGQLAACGRANQIFVYHVPSGQLLTRLTDPALLKSNSAAKPGIAHLDLVQSLAFSPEAGLLASGAYREVKLWRRPRNVHQPVWTAAAAMPMAVSPNGRWLVAATETNSLQLIELASGQTNVLATSSGKVPSALKFSPDSLRLCGIGPDNLVQIWGSTNGAVITSTNVATNLTAVTWLGNSKVVVGTGEKKLQVWQLPGETNSWTLAREWEAHDAGVTALEAADGKQILSAAANGVIRLWNTETAEKVREMNDGGPVLSLAVRPDYKRFASGGTNGAKLWDFTTGKVIGEMKGDRYLQEAVPIAERALTVVASELTYRKGRVDASEKELKVQEDRLKKADEAFAATDKTFQEKQKALQTLSASKSASEKALADLNAEIKKATEDFSGADTASRQAAVEAKAAMARATQFKIQSEQAALTKADVEKVAQDASAVAARTKSSPGSTNSPIDKMAADAEVVAVKARAFAETVALDAAAKSKAADEAKVAAEKSIDEVAAKAFLAGQLKIAYEKTTNGAPERLKQAADKLVAATNAVVTAEKENQKAEQARSIALNEKQLASKAKDQAVEAANAAKSALAAAEDDKKKKEAALEQAKKAATSAERPIRALAFSPDNLTLGTAGDDQLVHTWSAETGAPFETYHDHTGPVRVIHFTAASKLLSAASDHKCIAWELNPAWTLERTIGSGDGGSQLADRETLCVLARMESFWPAAGVSRAAAARLSYGK